MVTICTASLTFNNPTICPHSVFMCFVWISEQKAIISLYSINWLVFITEILSVYCAALHKSLCTLHVFIYEPAQCLYVMLHLNSTFKETNMAATRNASAYSALCFCVWRSLPLLPTLFQFNWHHHKFCQYNKRHNEGGWHYCCVLCRANNADAG